MIEESTFLPQPHHHYPMIWYSQQGAGWWSPQENSLISSPSSKKVSRPEGQTRSFPRGVENKLKYSCASVPTWIFGRRRKCLTETLPIDTAGSIEQKQSLRRAGHLLELQEGGGDLTEFLVHRERQGIITLRRCKRSFDTGQSPRLLPSLTVQVSVTGTLSQVE